jgi:hypothetical protein
VRRRIGKRAPMADPDSNHGPGAPRRDLASDDHRHAEKVVDEAESRAEDPETIREVIEGELEEEGLSDEGGHIGQHTD